MKDFLMCNACSKKTPFLSTKGKIYIGVILLAIVAGLAEAPILHQIATAISDVFIKIFKCISLPIIALSVIVTLSQYNADTVMKKVWRTTLFFTLLTTLIAASVACLLYVTISPSNLFSALPLHSTLPSLSSSENYLSHLKKLIPDTILAPFIEHHAISALLVSGVMGVAIRFIPDDKARESLISTLRGIHGVFLVITAWVIKIIPIALFGFVTTTILQFKQGINITGLGGYLSVVVLANVIQGIIILPLLLHINRVNPWVTAKGMWPALSMAFFSKSSAGTLPVTMANAERHLNVHPRISQFVLPLCTSINMNGCAAFIFTTVIYVMQNNGMDISVTTLLLWILLSTVAAIGNAGVPMGCFFLSASLLSSMNVPITLLGIILPFYSLIDMLETSLNVWSDACITKVIDVKTRAEENIPATHDA